jgi:hypothetical protein
MVYIFDFLMIKLFYYVPINFQKGVSKCLIVNYSKRY